MATMSSPTAERRHITDRRSSRLGLSAKNLNALDWVAMALITIGGLNWGLMGLFDIDFVASIFGQMSALTRVIYTLIGVSALYSIYSGSKLFNRESPHA
jgi:uncharacterized membrane protein YuzA (DUF378 family)